MALTSRATDLPIMLAVSRFCPQKASAPAALEVYGPRELDGTATSYPVNPRATGDGAGYFSKGRAGKGRLGTGELRTVAQLKGVRPRLQRYAFPYGKGLED
jgi:hypothetical protein